MCTCTHSQQVAGSSKIFTFNHQTSGPWGVRNQDRLNTVRGGVAFVKAKPGRFGGLRLELKLGDLRANRKNGDEVGRHGWCWGGADLAGGRLPRLWLSLETQRRREPSSTSGGSHVQW